jgi:hypothetical protein
METESLLRPSDILGLVDVQPTFMPGGELPVAEGDRVVPVINRLLTAFTHAFAAGLAPSGASVLRQRASRKAAL